MLNSMLLVLARSLRSKSKIFTALVFAGVRSGRQSNIEVVIDLFPLLAPTNVDVKKKSYLFIYLLQVVK